MIVFCFIVAFACLFVALLPYGNDWETKTEKRQRLTLAMGRALRHSYKPKQGAGCKFSGLHKEHKALR